MKKESQIMPAVMPPPIGMSPGGPMGAMPPMEGQPIDLESMAIQQVSDIINNKFSYLANGLKNIEVISKDENKGHFLLIATIENQNGIFYMPIFIIGGEIKPLNMLYSKKSGMFIPNSKEWLQLNEVSTMPQLGEAAKQPSTMYTDVDIRPIMIPPTTGRYSYASMPDDEYAFPNLVRMLNNKGKQKLLDFFEKNADIAEAAFNTYGKDLEDALRSDYVETNKKIADYVERKQLDNKPIEVFTQYDNRFKKEYSNNLVFWYNKLINDGYVVKDNRDPSNLNTTITIEEPTWLITANEPGFYRIWCEGKGIQDVMVIQNLVTTAYKTKPSAVPERQSTYRHSKVKNVGYYSDEEPLVDGIGSTAPYIILFDDGTVIYTNKAPLAIKKLSLSDINPDGVIAETIKSGSNIEKAIDKGLKKDAEYLFLNITSRGIKAFRFVRTFRDAIVKDKEGLTLRGPSVIFYYPFDNPYNDFAVLKEEKQTLIVLPRNVKIIEINSKSNDSLYRPIDNPDFFKRQYESLMRQIGARKEIITKDDTAPRGDSVVKAAEYLGISIQEAEDLFDKVAEEGVVTVFVVSPYESQVLREIVDDIFNGTGEYFNKIAQMDAFYDMLKIAQQQVAMMSPDAMQQANAMQMIPPQMMMQQPSPQDMMSIIDGYIQSLGDNYKDVAAKVEEIQKMIMLLSDIKANIAAQLQMEANQTPVEQQIRDAASIGKSSLDAALSYYIGMSGDLEGNVNIYMPILLKAIDSTAKILINIYNDSEALQRKIGPVKAQEVEDKTRKVFENLGKYYLYLKTNLLLDQYTNLMGNIK
jgi:hypothetical protein